MLPVSSKYWQQRFWQWVDRRRPPASQHRLNRANLFIFPSREGLGFLVLILLLWLLGTNYENNLVLGLAFLLTTLFVVSILHTFVNLSGISVQWVNAKPVFQGETGEIRLLITRTDKRPRDNIRLRWSSGKVAVCDLINNAEQTVVSFVETDQRGWFDPGRLIIESFYPLGIMRCWSRLQFNNRLLVYPRPVDAGSLPPAESIGDEGEMSHQRGSDEFNGFRDYQPGDSLKNLAWKQYARGMGVYTKDHASYVDRRRWLDWDALAGMGTEQRLSRLCFWVLEADKSQDEYGLRLPGVTIPPATGPAHREQVLRCLALFGQGDKAQEGRGE